MKDYESWEIAGHELEYIDETHTYLVDGVIVPSITQCLKIKFGNKYAGIDSSTLKRAADKGTEVHEAIENYCVSGMESDLPEVKNFKFLQKQYAFSVSGNEKPVILFAGDIPIMAGRLDLVLIMSGKVGLADIKRTSTLDKEYLSYQLNLYRIAYRQSYGIEAEFLRGVHLRDDVRKFVTIPINEEMTWEFINSMFDGGDINGKV